MRELKFRVWSKKYQMFDHDPMWPNNQHMYETFLLDGNGDLREFITSDGENFFWDLTNNAKEDLIVQQYTGLKDKNGKEIYEGDIVKVARCHTVSKEVKPGVIRVEGVEDGIEIGVVIYSPFKYWVSFDHIRYDDGDDLIYNSDRYEIIGNIFENPELINEN